MKKNILWIIIVVVIIVAGVLFFIGIKNESEEKTTMQAVTQLFGQKFNRSAGTIIITVNADSGKFAKGTYSFNDQMGGGGVWFAAKTNNGWELAFSGNGIVDCTSANKYNFPKEIIPQCIDTQNNNNLIER